MRLLQVRRRELVYGWIRSAKRAFRRLRQRDVVRNDFRNIRFSSKNEK